jgi:cell division inhibitor SulA
VQAVLVQEARTQIEMVARALRYGAYLLVVVELVGLEERVRLNLVGDLRDLELALGLAMEIRESTEQAVVAVVAKKVVQAA